MTRQKKSLFCEKVGMTQIILDDGEFVPVTVLKAYKNTVLKVKTTESDGYNSVVLSVGEKKESRCSKPYLGIFKKVELQPSQYIKEFRNDNSSNFNVGDSLTTDVFNEGDKLSTRSKSKGLGFTGTIKRWNFKRGLMTHGSKTHRIPGSIGAGTTPSRVTKGKKMSGRKGADTTFSSNLLLVKKTDDLLFLKGSIPGKKRIVS